MTGLDIAAFVVLAVVAGLIIYLFAFLGGLPGRVAEERNHSQAQAIRIGGWATLIMAAVGWPFVLMWAYVRPATGADAESSSGDADLAAENQRLRERVMALEAQVAAGKGTD